MSRDVFDVLIQFNTQDFQHMEVRKQLIAYFRAKYASLCPNGQIPDPLFFDERDGLLRIFFPDNVKEAAVAIGRNCGGGQAIEATRIIRGQPRTGFEIILSRQQTESLGQQANLSIMSASAVSSAYAQPMPWQRPGDSNAQSEVHIYYDPTVLNQQQVLQSLGDHYSGQLDVSSRSLAKNRMVVGPIRIFENDAGQRYTSPPEVLCITAAAPKVAQPGQHAQDPGIDWQRCGPGNSNGLKNFYDDHYLLMRRILFLAKDTDVLVMPEIGLGVYLKISDEQQKRNYVATAYQAWQAAWHDMKHQRPKRLVLSHFSKDRKVPFHVSEQIREPEIELIATDVLAYSADLQVRGEQVALLNPGSDVSVGGIYKKDVSTLEEKIAKKTTLMTQHAPCYNSILQDASLMCSFPKKLQLNTQRTVSAQAAVQQQFHQQDIETASISSEKAPLLPSDPTSKPAKIASFPKLTKAKAQEISDLFKALGLRVKVTRTELDQFTGNGSQEKQREFAEKGLQYTVVLDLDLTGYLDLLKDLSALAASAHQVQGSRTIFMRQLMRWFDRAGNGNYRILMDRTPDEEIIEMSSMDIQSSRQHSSQHQFLVAINDEMINTIRNSLEQNKIMENKQRLEIILSQLGFPTSASYFIEGILNPKNGSEFCLECSKSDQAKFLVDIKKLLNAIGVQDEDYDVIRHRFDSKNLSVLLHKNALNRLLALSPDFLASLQDIVRQYVGAKQAASPVEADAAYDLLCHMLKEHGEDVKGAEKVPKASDAVAEMFLSYWLPVNFYTTLPNRQRFNHIREWRDSLTGMAYRGQLIEQAEKRGLWSRIKNAFSRQRPDFEAVISDGAEAQAAHKNHLFLLQAIGPNGMIGRRIMHNRQLLAEFLVPSAEKTPPLTAYFFDQNEKKIYLEKWVETLTKMRDLEYQVSNQLYTSWSALPESNPYKKQYGLALKQYNEAYEAVTKAIQAVNLSIKNKDHALLCQGSHSQITAVIESVQRSQKESVAEQWDSVLAQHETIVLPAAKKAHQQSVKAAFQDMGVGKVTIKETRDANRNVQYQVTLPQDRANDPSVLQNLKNMGMQDVTSNRIFGAETVSIQLTSRQRVLTCTPDHIQGFVNQHAAYKESVNVLNFVSKQLGYKTKVLPPYGTQNGPTIEFQTVEEAKHFSELMQALKLNIDSNGTRISFSKENLKQLKQNGSIVVFFKEFSDKITASRKANDSEGATLLNSLLSHVISPVFDSNRSFYRDVDVDVDVAVPNHAPIRVFDGSGVFSMRSAINKWKSDNYNRIQHHDDQARRQGFFSRLFKPKVVLESFMTEQVDFYGDNIPYTMLCQRHALPAIQEQQERSLDTVLRLYQAQEIDRQQLLKLLSEIVDSQKKLGDAVVFQINNHFAFSDNIISVGRLTALGDRVDSAYLIATHLKTLADSESSIQEQTLAKKNLGNLKNSYLALAVDHFINQVNGSTVAPQPVSAVPVGQTRSAQKAQKSGPDIVASAAWPRADPVPGAQRSGVSTFSSKAAEPLQKHVAPDSYGRRMPTAASL